MFRKRISKSFSFSKPMHVYPLEKHTCVSLSHTYINEVKTSMTDTVTVSRKIMYYISMNRQPRLELTAARVHTSMVLDKSNIA